MPTRIVHLLLTFLILTQSVLVFVAMPSTSLASDFAMEMVLDTPHHSTQMPCDNGDLSTLDSTPPCCETMDEVNCTLSCASVATAISCSLMQESVHDHKHYPLDSGYALLHHTVSGFYHPPRIS